MRDECPDPVDALVNALDEVSNPGQVLNGEVSLNIIGCSDSNGASGTIKNNSTVTVDVSIEVQFTTDSGVLVDTRFDLVNGVRPGQTAEWDTFFSGDSMDRCEADITAVYESGASSIVRIGLGPWPAGGTDA